jgi:ribosome recycling factor
MHRGLDNVQELTDEYIGKLNDIVNTKEEEIMEV